MSSLYINVRWTGLRSLDHLLIIMQKFSFSLGVFPSGIIPGGGQKIIWCRGLNPDVPHANMLLLQLSEPSQECP